jgi:hypothetical protein
MVVYQEIVVVKSCLIIILLAGVVVWPSGKWVHAQTIGDEAEMERLRVKAEEAIANDDPEGAATSMGRAALMAAELRKRQTDESRQLYFRGADALFRSQEQAYRSLALFRRAGGQPPASSGACGGLSLAQNHVQQAIKLFDQGAASSGEDQKTATGIAKLKDTAEDWVTVIASLHKDFQCP